ncbi:MAG: tRNA (adenosine(37)-N6)-dimethylallyltransferase MiaA [Bacteroidales bacterium]
MAVPGTAETPLLVVIAGPTAVGKTSVAVRLAGQFQTEIISADSRQIYKEMAIGVARPDEKELSQARHHIVAYVSVSEPYSAARFESDALEVLERLFRQHSVVIMAGGSGLYIDAVCKGIDFFPDPDPGYREHLKSILGTKGLEPLRDMLKEADPAYYRQVDLNNPARIIRALEVIQVTGRPYSEQRLNQVKKRPFRILKIALELPRTELDRRISARTDKMIEQGLIEEVKSLQQFRHLNALNTVGYKEIFRYLDGDWSLEQAVEKIKTNTRRYARRQLTWFRRDPEWHWFDAGDFGAVSRLITESLD